MNQLIKINARDCKILELSKKEVKLFLLNNHKQGFASYKIAYGLFYKDELVQLMSFGKPRFNSWYKWEIIRECSKKDYQVRGGTSKLWEYFKNHNKVRSCICYSYPHNEKFTNHYIKYCGFKNIERAKPKTKVYFEGQWNGELKRIDKSILEKHGVDRLLKTSQGQDRSNEQILLDLGFKKKEEDGYSPQVDIYYPFGLVYRIDDLTDGTFYIGLCEREHEWFNKEYLGSGIVWKRHLKRHPNKSKHRNRRNQEAHLYKRTVLKDNFGTPKEAREFEQKEIKKFFKYDGKKWVKQDSNCWNTKIFMQNAGYVPPICPECGGKMGRHYKNCSEAQLCPECGCVNGHKEDCSYNKIEACPYCGRKTGPHKKDCPLFEYPYTCPECGSHNKGAHKKDCSQYKKPKGECPYCGTPAGGLHKKDCPNRPKEQKCPECGYILSSNRHAKTCSHYKETKPQKVCPECGGVGVHKGTCSHAVKCKECGGTCGHHRKGCSKYSSKNKYKKVYCETNDTVYDSASETAIQLFGSDDKKILSCIRNVANPNNSRKSYKGYKFVYLENKN